MKKIIENIIILDNKEYTYIIHHKQIKNIYFRVKDDLKIHVSANKLISTNYIERLLKENTFSLIKMYDKILEKKNEDLKYLGNKLILIIMDTKSYIDNNYIYAKNNEEAQKYIYSNAKNIFTTRLNQIKPLFQDIPDFNLKIRKMTSKWGVCNKKSMSITLNTELITKDLNLIDYVIIHELCHFKYMNHSKEYWNYVAEFYPYYKQARKLLKY
ncbi:MAG: DUF45 domain-containing protein [Bacilli bacterium]|nr:DUF45 domain-containing protein [Bacilli bacterium]MDD4406626.1 DUF45 domain-containing protein [Bacilli bacterium]